MVFVIHGLSQDLNGAAAAFDQAQNHFHGRAFSCAVGAEKAVDAALGDLQIHIIYAGSVVVGFCELIGFYCQCHNFLHFSGV